MRQVFVEMLRRVTPGFLDGVFELSDQWAGSGDGDRLIRSLQSLLEGSLPKNVLHIRRYGDLNMPFLAPL